MPFCTLVSATTTLSRLRITAEPSVHPFPLGALLKGLPRLQELALAGDLWTNAAELAALLGCRASAPAPVPPLSPLQTLRIDLPSQRSRFDGDATPRQILRALLPLLPALRCLQLGESSQVTPGLLPLIAECAPQLVVLDVRVACILPHLAAVRPGAVFPLLRKMKVISILGDGSFNGNTNEVTER